MDITIDFRDRGATTIRRFVSPHEYGPTDGPRLQYAVSVELLSWTKGYKHLVNKERKSFRSAAFKPAMELAPAHSSNAFEGIGAEHNLLGLLGHRH